MGSPVSSRVYVRLTEFLFRCLKPDVNYTIAKVLIERIHDFPDIYIEEIALNATTTPASVTKFCKKLGYSSFKEMRNDLAEYSSSWLLDSVSGQKDPEEMLQSFLEKNRKIEESIFDSLDRQQCQRIAAGILEKKKVAVFGSTHSSSAVNLFRELLSQEGLIVYELHRRSENEIIQQVFQEADAVFIISLTGEWVFKNMPLLKTETKAEKYLLTYQPQDIFPSGIFEEIISFSGSDFLLKSNYYSQKIMQSWILFFSIFIKANKNF